MHFVAGCVVEGSMVFCQKNNLEHSEVPWGFIKELFTNTQGQSDIVTHKTNFWNTDLFYTALIINVYDYKQRI